MTFPRIVYSPRKPRDLFSMKSLAGRNCINGSCISVILLSERCGRGAWLVQSVEHTALASGVVSSSPTLGAEVTQMMSVVRKGHPVSPCIWGGLCLGARMESKIIRNGQEDSSGNQCGKTPTVPDRERPPAVIQKSDEFRRHSWRAKRGIAKH